MVVSFSDGSAAVLYDTLFIGQRFGTLDEMPKNLGGACPGSDNPQGLKAKTVKTGPPLPPKPPPLRGLLEVSHVTPIPFYYSLKIFQWVPYGTPINILKFSLYLPYGSLFIHKEKGQSHENFYTVII